MTLITNPGCKSGTGVTLEQRVRRFTCGGCTHLVFTKIVNAGFFGCSIIGFVVPHRIDCDRKEVVFWRIPVECPLPGHEIEKSEEKQPKHLWHIESLQPNNEILDLPEACCVDSDTVNREK